MEKLMIGTRIKEIRSSLGLSQSDFGALVDSSTKQQVSNWERGAEAPSINKLHIIANLGNRSLEWFTFGVDSYAGATAFIATPIPVVKKFFKDYYNSEDILRGESTILGYEQDNGLFYFTMDSDALFDGSPKSIRAGDLLLTGFNMPYFPGDIVICLTKDMRYFVRYLEVSDDVITLKATNYRYPPITFDRADIITITRVIAVKPQPFNI